MPGVLAPLGQAPRIRQGASCPSVRHPAPARVQGARCHKVRLKNQAETRWAYHIEAASHLKETFDDIVDTVEQIRDSADSTGEQTQAAIGLLRSLISFVFWLMAIIDVLTRINVLSNMLQSKKETL